MAANREKWRINLWKFCFLSICRPTGTNLNVANEIPALYTRNSTKLLGAIRVFFSWVSCARIAIPSMQSTQWWNVEFELVHKFQVEMLAIKLVSYGLWANTRAYFRDKNNEAKGEANTYMLPSCALRIRFFWFSIRNCNGCNNNWRMPAEPFMRIERANHPDPGAHIHSLGVRVRVWVRAPRECYYER